MPSLSLWPWRSLDRNGSVSLRITVVQCKSYVGSAILQGKLGLLNVCALQVRLRFRQKILERRCLYFGCWFPSPR